ncbi:MAG: hypothetical protein PHW82_14825, partial [Bacteroidales bacterium]|nr:hypothetical protein [Bacteroidales bacterium]
MIIEIFFHLCLDKKHFFQGKRILFFCHDFWIAMHQKIMPKEIRRHILTLDFYYVQSKVKINEFASWRTQK